MAGSARVPPGLLGFTTQPGPLPGWVGVQTRPGNPYPSIAKITGPGNPAGYGLGYQTQGDPGGPVWVPPPNNYIPFPCSYVQIVQYTGF